MRRSHVGSLILAQQTERADVFDLPSLSGFDVQAANVAASLGSLEYLEALEGGKGAAFHGILCFQMR
jgi:hypothetical protein